MPYRSILLLSFSLLAGSVHAAMQNQYALVFFFKALVRTAIRHHLKSLALASASNCLSMLFLLMLLASPVLKFPFRSPLKLAAPFP